MLSASVTTTAATDQRAVKRCAVTLRRSSGTAATAAGATNARVTWTMPNAIRIASAGRKTVVRGDITSASSRMIAPSGRNVQSSTSDPPGLRQRHSA